MTGWYADLFYDRDEILQYKPIVADVHTQPTDESGAMVGRVLDVLEGLAITLERRPLDRLVTHS